MIGLSTALADPMGAFVLSPFSNSELHKRFVRYQRVQTLDGSVAVEVRGLFDSDKTASLVVPFDEQLYLRLPQHSRWTLTTDEGAFAMIAVAWDLTDQGISLTLEGV